MKKIILGTLVCLTINTLAQSYKQGQVDMNLGVGIGNTFVNRGVYIGPGYSYNSLPTFNASAEYGITNAIGIGGYLGYTSFKYTYAYRDFNNNGWYDYTDQYKWSFFIIGIRGAYHFDEFIKIDKLDVYGGLMLGYNIASLNYTSTDPYHGTAVYGSAYGGFAWSLFGGARYRFTDNVGVFGELGYGISVLNIGLNLKFN